MLAANGSKHQESPIRSNFESNINSLKKTVIKHSLGKDVSGKLIQIEKDYIQMREVTLNAGVAGINLAVIFHEVERGVEELNKEIKKETNYADLKKQANHLAKLLEGFTPLLRRSEQKKFTAKKLMKRAMKFSENRFTHHKVISSCPILTDETPDFNITGPFGLIHAAVNNVLDNAIHWTSLQAEKKSSSYTAAVRVLTLLDWFKEGPAIVILDNGPGFTLSPMEAIKPFQTTRPGGMGVGLYYADKVMESIGGRILITTAEELDLPMEYCGGAVVMIFKKDK